MARIPLAPPEPMRIRGRAPWTAADDPGPDEATRFDLIRHHPYTERQKWGA